MIECGWLSVNFVVAYKDLVQRAAYSKDDEQDLVLIGYVAFLDPPKESAGPAIAVLQKHGVTVKILTGDNDLVNKVCHDVGLSTDRILLGADIEAMSDEQLAEAVQVPRICLPTFARS